MKKYILLLMLMLASLGGAQAATLNAPYFAPANGINYLGPVYSYGSGTYYPAQLAQGISGVPNITPSNRPVDWLNTSGETLCMTYGTSAMPSASTPGTCDGGSITVSPSAAISPALTGSGQLNLLATKAGNTNSSVTSIVFTIAPNIPAAGAYAYGVAPVLTGLQGQNIIYTTDGSTPAASGSCVATGTGTAIANQTAITALGVGTTTLKASSCLSGTLTPISTSPWTYTVNAAAQNHFVRSDGGTLLTANVPAGQCDGMSDVSVATATGNGTLPHCAVNDVRLMWDDDSGAVGSGSWALSHFAGGDTLVIRSCAASVNQDHPSNPNCRIGWDNGNGGGPTNLWCQFVGNISCYNPPIPAGDATHHTQILGGCAFGTYTCTPIGTNGPLNGFPWASTNETQLFGGFGLQYAFNAQATSNVDIIGLEITTHNGVCVRSGVPGYPRYCSTSPTIDDYADTGLIVNAQSSGITLQDVYIHGFSSNGIFGPIGDNTFSMTRVAMNFNHAAGWQFDCGNACPDVPTATLSANYVTQIGNGCDQQYPIVNTGFPALSCYDDNANGFGDSWSGQDTALDTMTCVHCVQAYNTKDGFIGPHPNVKTLTITQSQSIGNMGAPWKLITASNATMYFFNNSTVGDCGRMGSILPGAGQSFGSIGIASGTASGSTETFQTSTQAFAVGDTIVLWNFQHSGGFLNGQTVTVLSAGLTTTQFEAVVSGATTFTDLGNSQETTAGKGGGYLSDYCRAGIYGISYNVQQNDSIIFAGNLWVSVGASAINFAGCGTAYNSPANNCGSSPIVSTDEIFLGYTVASSTGQPFVDNSDASITFTVSHDSIFGLATNGHSPTCGTNGVICTDPALVNEPPQCGGSGCTSNTYWDGFTTLTNIVPAGGSPVIHTGVAVSGLTTDFFGVTRPNPPSIGAAEPSTAVLNTITVTPNPGGVVVGATLSMTAACAYSDGSTTPCTVTWTDTNSHSSVNSVTGVVTGVSVGADTVTATISTVFGTATVNISAASTYTSKGLGVSHSLGTTASH